MKKLEKIRINPDKLMKEEDLFRVKGGYEGSCCMCYAWGGFITLGAMAAASSEDCYDLCESLFPPDSYGIWNC